MIAKITVKYAEKEMLLLVVCYNRTSKYRKILIIFCLVQRMYGKTVKGTCCLTRQLSIALLMTEISLET